MNQLFSYRLRKCVRIWPFFCQSAINNRNKDRTPKVSWASLMHVFFLRLGKVIEIKLPVQSDAKSNVKFLNTLCKRLPRLWQTVSPVNCVGSSLRNDERHHQSPPGGHSGSPLEWDIPQPYAPPCPPARTHSGDNQAYRSAECKTQTSWKMRVRWGLASDKTLICGGISPASPQKGARDCSVPYVRHVWYLVMKIWPYKCAVRI